MKSTSDYKNITFFLFFSGYSGQKCDVFGSTTVAPLKCSDCSSAGTQYCTSNNGVFQCVCKTGKQIRNGMIRTIQFMLITSASENISSFILILQATLVKSVISNRPQLRHPSNAVTVSVPALNIAPPTMEFFSVFAKQVSNYYWTQIRKKNGILCNKLTW